MVAFYKPLGIVSNCPQKGERSIVDLLPDSMVHLATIGRLDKDSEGLILLSDDGVLANQCLNSGLEFEKEYEITLDQPVDEDHLNAFESGLQLDDVMLKPVQTQQISSRKVRLILTEGKNRQIRRMFDYFNYRVHRLVRLRYHSLSLSNCRIVSGQWKLLDTHDVYKMFQLDTK